MFWLGIDVVVDPYVDRPRYLMGRILVPNHAALDRLMVAPDRWVVDSRRGGRIVALWPMPGDPWCGSS